MDSNISANPPALAFCAVSTLSLFFTSICSCTTCDSTTALTTLLTAVATTSLCNNASASFDIVISDELETKIPS